MKPPIQFPEGEISCDELPQEIKVTKTYILGSSINLEASTPMGIVTGMGSSNPDDPTLTLQLIFMGYLFTHTLPFTPDQFNSDFIPKAINTFTQDSLSMYKELMRMKILSGEWKPFGLDNPI